MTDNNDQDRKKVLHLSGKGKLELKKTVDAGSVRQSFSHGRSKTVTVEVKRKRTIEKGAVPGIADGGAAARRAAEGLPLKGGGGQRGQRGAIVSRQLTKEELESRKRALQGAMVEAERRRQEDELPLEEEDLDAIALGTELVVDEAPPILDAETLRQRELEEMRLIQEAEREAAAQAEQKRKDEEARRRESEEARRRESGETAAPRSGRRGEDERPGERGGERSERGPARSGDAAGGHRRPAAAGAPTTTPPPRPGAGIEVASPKAAAMLGRLGVAGKVEDDDDLRRSGGARKGSGKTAGAPGGVKPAPASPRKSGGERRRGSAKLTVSQALNEEGNERTRSLAAVRRARERERLRLAARAEVAKVTRDVVVPEVITVQELANRMAERGADVIKALMRMGVMATITQTIDADTAELVISEFGHRIRRVSEADVETGMRGTDDQPDDLLPRAPVVTVMGHVDHGKTSLLDALRSTDVASREAGGITQHIGAYQVVLKSGARITFIDTPGHAAFTEMRARGANVTDVVVLVVAADDGIMPQTIEAIHHAKAAKVPIIVAINKMDLPDANPARIRQDLLQHNLVVEELGGEILAVEVSAKGRLNLERLEEAILLQAEVLELQANPNRTAEGVVIEAKLERGRGSVATVLVQRGTLRVGDVFVAGSEWGRVRALINDRSKSVMEAEPAMPVEVLGLNGTPLAGDDFTVVESETRAREITEFRQRKKREAVVAATARGSLEQMFSRIQAGETKELPIVIKGDVQGSIEAISGALEKLTGTSTEVKVRVLHASVGAINESDITLANASKAMVIGFNVRANPQARDMAKRDGIDIRYYSIIYNVIDDVRAALTGMLTPTLRERFLGNAQIREVFTITKVGKVAGCMVTEGVVKRGAGVRLLRDNVVIHEGTLKTLKRFKDEVKDVREGYECGMAFENYDNILAGDIIEAFEMEEVARQL